VEFADLVKSGLGAVLGFVLGQIVNLAKLGREWWCRPRLVIDTGTNGLILAHSDYDGNGQGYDEKIYGFCVRNVGRGMAKAVKFQLLKIECRKKSSPDFVVVSNHCFELTTYKNANEVSGSREAVLVPSAGTWIALAAWREDSDAVFPLVTGMPDYYEESCSGSVEFRFTVVVFADNAKFVTSQLNIVV